MLAAAADLEATTDTHQYSCHSKSLLILRNQHCLLGVAYRTLFQRGLSLWSPQYPSQAMAESGEWSYEEKPHWISSPQCVTATANEVS